jgi:hypothetical protein
LYPPPSPRYIRFTAPKTNVDPPSFAVGCGDHSARYHSVMYPNPWIRKHSTIRQVIDKLLSLNTNKTKKFDAMLNKKKQSGGNRTAAVDKRKR